MTEVPPLGVTTPVYIDEKTGDNSVDLGIVLAVFLSVN